jgi:uncharacterized membrane protein
MLEEIFPGLAHAPNVHPLFVHFPIALWLVAGLFCLLGALRQREDFFVTGRWLLYLGTLGALVAVGTGLWAADSMGHDSPGHELVHVHRNLMLAASGIGLTATVAAFALRKRQSVGARWAVTALLLATIGVLTIGADRGAALVFQYGMGTAAQTSPAADVDSHAHDTQAPGPDEKASHAHEDHGHEHHD